MIILIFWKSDIENINLNGKSSSIKGPAGHPGDRESTKSISLVVRIEIIDWTGGMADITKKRRIPGRALTRSCLIRYAGRVARLDARGLGP
jgi:hypothetical protein